MAKQKPKKAPKPVENGLKSFSMHSTDDASGPTMAALGAAEAAHPSFTFAAAAGGKVNVDPESVARVYLEQALGSPAVPQFAAPVADEVPSEFKSLGAESVPLTGTTVVKFRQNFSKIPVYGSLVTVELDEANNLLGINSALGTPRGVSPIAKVSAADAVKAVEKHPGHAKELAGIVPRLNYYFDGPKSKWRLVYILEDVPVVPETKGPSPVLMDYVVDAHTGAVVVALPRTPTVGAVAALAAATVAVRDTAPDGLGVARTFQVEQAGAAKLMKDSTLNVQTFDFKFKDPVTQSASLPGTPLKNPPAYAPAAVSAHANAAAVATFLRTVLRRNNIDNQGGLMRSSINCVDVSQSPDGKEWVNAFWNGRQMVYGQRHSGTGFLSMCVALDVVGHEMMHGVTDMTSRLEYAFQPGALNESYSDIFGVIIANRPNANPRTWKWQMGRVASQRQAVPRHVRPDPAGPTGPHAEFPGAAQHAGRRQRRRAYQQRHPQQGGVQHPHGRERGGIGLHAGRGRGVLLPGPHAAVVTNLAVRRESGRGRGQRPYPVPEPAGGGPGRQDRGHLGRLHRRRNQLTRGATRPAPRPD